MRLLHVAALPFPTEQGTQGLIHQMLSALAAAGHETHLLCYREAAFERPGDYAVHRAPGPIKLQSLRSGPSLQKIVLDVALAQELRRLTAELRPQVVVAHHVEAALCALTQRTCPVWFVAHTSLREELGTYFPPLGQRLWAWCGGALDRFLCTRSARTFAVSPSLAALLRAEAKGAPPLALVPPWPLAPALSSAERAAARQRLGVAPEAEVVLYAGNLDGYQGLLPLLAGMASLSAERPRLRLLLATASGPSEVERWCAAQPALPPLNVQKLHGEPGRRLAYAAADLVAVPRAIRGGVPVKLLDAFARGVPVVCAPRAMAGFEGMAGVCSVVAGATPRAWSHALSRELDALPRARARAQLARDYVAREHSWARFEASLMGSHGAVFKH